MVEKNNNYKVFG